MSNEKSPMLEAPQPTLLSNASAHEHVATAAEVSATAPSHDPPSAPERRFTPPSNGEVIAVDGRYYFVGNFLGAGAFGHVYECSDEWANELVAKILVPRNQTYDEVRESWVQELSKLAALRHPNVTYVHNAFEYKDTFYIVMERCSMTLDALINAPDLNGEIWIPYVARDILQGLEFIHAAGYIHRTYTRGTSLFHKAQIAWCLRRRRCGRSKSAISESRLETEVRAFNTLLAQWMLPPEAIDPTEFGPVSRATDIYHVGLLLLAVLMRRSPTFTQQEILAGLPRQTAEGLNSKYAPAISRTLRRHVAARTPTAMQFWREIQSATSAP